MAEAVNPQAGTDTGAPKAPPGVLTEHTNSDEKAVESVQARIDALFKPAREPAEPETRAEPERAEPVEEPAKEPEPVEADEAETPEAEPEATKEEEPPDLSTVPNTVEGLAEAIGITPQELSEHLRVTVKVNGKEQAVTLAEAVKGHQLEADYRTKTSELAESRRTLASQVEQAQQALQARALQIDELGAALLSQLDLGPDDAVLRKMLDPNDPSYDPNGYLVQKAVREERLGALNKARQARLADIQKQEAKQRADFAKYRKEQQETLLRDSPELKDNAKLREFEDETRSTLMVHYGFADEEVTRFMQTFDARQVRIVRDAIKFRKMEDGKKKLESRVKGLPRVARPGTGKSIQKGNSEAKLQVVRKGGKGAEAAAHSWLMDVLNK